MNIYITTKGIKTGHNRRDIRTKTGLSNKKIWFLVGWQWHRSQYPRENNPKELIIGPLQLQF